MLLLPKTIGPITLVSKLGTGGVAESYRGTFQGPRLKDVVVRRVLPYVTQDQQRASALEQRVRDLLTVDHAQLVKTVEWIVDSSDRFIVEEQVDGISLRKLLNWTRAQGTVLPANVFLNLATQMCTALEALHATSGTASGTDRILHLGLKPATVFVTREGQIRLGGYGLTPSPTLLPQGNDGGAPVPFRMEYLSPEQAISGTSLTAASDLFSLGSILYELLTLEPLFRSPTGRETLQKVQRAEITTNLLRAQAIMPGFDKILYRSLSLNPRHRYQRAFVMREDIRALMSGYSFSFINQDTIAYLEPLFSGAANSKPAPTTTLNPPQDTSFGAENTLAHIPVPSPVDHTASKEPSSELAAEPIQGADVPLINPTAINLPPRTDLDIEPDDWPPLTDDTTGEITSEQETEVTAELPAPAYSASPPAPPIPPTPAVQATPPSGPRTVAQIRRSSDLDPDPLSPPEPLHHRQAHAALRSIRAAASNDVDTSTVDVDHWAQSKNRRNITILSALVGMSLIFTAAAGIYWGIGNLLPTEDLTDEAEAKVSADPPTSNGMEGPQPIHRPPTRGPTRSNDMETRPRASPSAESSSPASTESNPVFADQNTIPEPSSSSPVTESRQSASATYSSSRPTNVVKSGVTARQIEPPEDNERIDAYIQEQPSEITETAYSPITDWDDYAQRSQQGRLSPSDRIALEATPAQEEEAFTRSRALLLMNAQQTRDQRAIRLYIDQLFLIPANKYNPLYLTAEAVLHVDQSRYEAALISASKAEKHWESIPSDLMVMKLAEIYETKAQSHLGLYYQSEDINDLDRAERAWKRFREHALRNNQGPLLERADSELSKLAKTRERME